MNDLISVIVPIYNVEKYLEQCIESITNQSYTNLEIILVDDSSPDNCPAICDDWAKKDNRIRVIHKDNGGLSSARNAGITVATGKYITFVDSDDYIEPDMYEKLINIMYQTSSDIVSCKLRFVYDAGSYSVSSEDSCELTEYNSEEALSALIDDKLRQVVWNKLYKTELINNIQFEVGKYHEDEFWSYQVIGKSDKVTTIDYTGYNYRQRSDSIMGNTYSLKRLDAIDAKRLRQNYLDSHFPALSEQGLVNLYFTCIYHGQLALKYLDKANSKKAFKKLIYTLKSTKSAANVKSISAKQKIWIYLSKFSLLLTCKIRNLIGIGL